MDFHVPNEFHGTWRCDGVLPDGTTDSDIIEITPNDIGGIAETYNTLFEKLKDLAEETGAPFDTKFTETHPVEGYYTFNLSIMAGYELILVSGKLQLIDDNTMRLYLETSDSSDIFNQVYYKV